MELCFNIIELILGCFCPRNCNVKELGTCTNVYLCFLRQYYLSLVTTNFQLAFFPMMLKKKINLSMCDALHDFGPFVQFKKREKHPGRKVAG